jgi:phosphodiesterase/alkaline phosphatase D-like protein
LRSITYVSNSENPKTGTRSIVFRVTDGTGGALAQSNEVSRQVAVTAVNDAPEIIAGSSATATEDTPLFFGISTGNEIAIIDLDKDLVEVDLSVNSGRINLNRVQGVEVIGGEDGTSQVRFSGLVRNVNKALAGLIYRPEKDANGLSADLLQIKVEDKGNTGSGGVLKDDIAVQIHITSVNDAPVISAPSTATVAEGESITFSESDETAVSIADIDAGVGNLELQITAGPGTVDLSTIGGLDGTGDGTGTLSYTGSLSDLNVALSDMVYTPPPSEQGQKLTLNIEVSDLGNTGDDGLVQSATSTINIGSTSVNDAPVISAPTTLVTDEDTPVIFSSDGIERLAISDSDAGDEDMSFTITSVGTVTLGSTAGLAGQGNESSSMTYTGALTNINNALDNLIFTPVADTSGVSAGRFNLFVSDLGHTGDTFQERTDTATVLIDISAVNDAPVITAPVSAATNEDTPLNFGDSNENNISVSDIDVGDGTMSIDITANRAVSFQTVQGLIGSGNGTLALSYTGTLTAVNAALSGMIFTPLADEHDEDGQALGEITISVTDNGNSGANSRPGSDEVTITINVNPVNDAPVLSEIETYPLIYQENSLPIPITLTTAITDIDSDVISGAEVTLVDYERVTDALAFTAANGIEASFDRKNGVLSLLGNATVELYESALRSVTYHNNSDNPTDTTRTVNFKVFDGGAVDSEGGTTHSNVLSRDITIIPVNDAPSITTTKLAVGFQDIGYAFRFDAFDPEGDDVVYSAPEAGTAWFQLDSETGAVTGTPTVLDTGTYRIQISVSDYEFTTTESFQIRIQPDIVSPKFISGPAPDGVSHSRFSVFLKANEIVSVTLHYSWVDTSGTNQSDSLTVDEFASKHILNVTDLLGSTAYRVIVDIRDEARNLTKSRPLIVETKATPDTQSPTFVKLPAAVSKSDTALTFAWSANETASAIVRVQSADGVDLEPELVYDIDTYSRNGSIELPGLSPSTTYEGQIELADVNGNGPGADDTDNNPARFAGRTRAAPDLSPPVFVATPGAQATTDDRTTIISKVNEPAVMTVQYGPTEEFGLELTTENFEYEPKITLSGLDATTTYFFRAKAQDERGNESKFTPAVRFRTKTAPDITAPEVIEGPVLASKTDKSLVITYGTNEPGTTILRYSPQPSVADSVVLSDPDTITVSDPTRVKKHVVTLSNLLPETVYYYSVSSEDGSGNTSTPRTGKARTEATPDIIAPAFTTIPQVTSVSSDKFTVKWDSDEASGSSGAADTVSAVLDDLGNTDVAFEVVDQNLVKSHTLTFSNLAAKTLYHWRIAMSDPKGNRAESVIQSVRTKSVPDTVAPILSRITVSAKDTSSAIIEFVTDEPGNSTIIYSPNYDAVSNADIDSVDSKSESELTAQHRVTVTGLTSSTKYYYRVKSKDAAGNESGFFPLSGSEPKDFKTPDIPDTTPPKISRISVSSRTVQGATINFYTNELSNTTVSFGLNSGEGDLTGVVEDGVLVLSHQISLTNLEPATTYHFRIGAKDQKGNETRAPGSSNLPRTFTTKAAPDILRPIFIEKPNLNYKSDATAFIKFTTNEPTDAKVYYKADDDEFFVFVSDHVRVESHSIQLSSLKRGSVYTFVVEVKDGAGNINLSSQDAVVTKVGPARFKITGIQQGPSGSFTTNQAPDTQAPVMISPPTITSRDDNSMTIQWATDELSTSTVDYGTDSNNFDQRHEDGALVTAHSLNITGLSPTTVYGYTASSTDPSNNGPTVSVASVVTTTAQPDVSPPVIETTPPVSSTYVSAADGASATIVWTTDEPSDTKVEFGTSSSLGGVKSISEAVTSHSVTVTRLTPGSVYHYRVASTDQSGNGPVTSNIDTFTAENQPDTQAPVISNVNTSGTANDRITVLWDTDELSTTRLSVVEHGTSGTITVSAGAFLTSHSATITQDNSGNAIKSATTYSLIVESFDASGNGVIHNSSITTAAAPDIVAPGVPENVSAEAGNAQAQVSWNAITDADLSGYDVFQDGSQIASGVTDTLYDVTGLDNGTSVEFTVRSVDNNGNASDVSSAATTTPLATLAPTAPTIAGTFDQDGNVKTTVSVKPILVVDNVTPVQGRSVPTYSFAVYGDLSLTNLVISTSGVVEGTSGNPTHWQVVDPTLPDGIALIDGTTYYWRARASDGVADGPWSPTATFIASSSEPVGVELAAFTAESDRGIVDIGWQTNSNLGLRGFHVYRSLNPGGPFELISGDALIAATEAEYVFQDRDVTINVTYYYQVEAINQNGASQRFGPITVKVSPPNRFTLDQNFPNPFNPVTSIRYELAVAGQVQLMVYNLLGQQVVTLVESRQQAGFHTVTWNGLNSSHRSVASGVYFYRIVVTGDEKNTFTSSKKMLLLK